MNLILGVDAIVPPLTTATTPRLRVHQAAGLPKDAANLSLDVVNSTLLQRMLEKSAQVRLTPDNHAQFAALLPPILRRLFNGEHLLLRSPSCNGRVVMLMIADQEAAAALGNHRAGKVFRPVGCIADLGPSAENRANIRRDRLERSDGGIGVGARADGGQAGHFRTDQEGIYATGGFAKMGIVQDHPAQRPFTDRAGPADSGAGNAEVCGCCRAEQRRYSGWKRWRSCPPILQSPQPENR